MSQQESTVALELLLRLLGRLVACVSACPDVRGAGDAARIGSTAMFSVLLRLASSELVPVETRHSLLSTIGVVVYHSPRAQKALLAADTHVHTRMCYIYQCLY